MSETPNLPYNPPIMDGSIVRSITIDRLERMCSKNPNLRGYLHGYIAEEMLEDSIWVIPGVTSVQKIKDSDRQKGDFSVGYKGHTLTIEAKSLESSTVKFDLLNDHWHGRVRIKGTGAIDVSLEDGNVVRTSCLKPGRFDILAIGCYAATGKWDFLFMDETMIPHDPKTDLLKTSFRIDPISTRGLTNSLQSLMDKRINA